VIQKTEGPVHRQRRQPHGETRELNGHRIQIHSVQTALRNQPSKSGSIRVAQIDRVARAGLEECGFVRRGEITARRDEKRPASH